MFFITYLRRELRRRMRQAVFIALGLAIGIGLVITVIGASSGVKAAQAKVLRALYGIGTDVTVTTKPKPPSFKPTTGGPTSGRRGSLRQQQVLQQRDGGRPGQPELRAAQPIPGRQHRPPA
jgi:hypothetical protein